MQPSSSQTIIQNPDFGTWQEQLKNTINSYNELCEFLELDFEQLKKFHLDPLLTPNFPLKVPKYFAAKIVKQDYQDPLLLQILPITRELSGSSGYCHDPLQENANYLKAPGLIHKYSSRVLLTMTGACGIHCRYCFRQNFPYDKNIVSTKQRYLQFDYIKNNPSVTEIILSGGDPLCLNNNYLDLFLAELSELKQIKIIRFHSRMPIVIPDRIDSALVNIFNKYANFKFIVVTHCNHPNELDDNIKNKMAELQKNNVTVLNQSVLLKNINDKPQTLVKLSNKLFECHILPYYLHLLDPVTGTEHFDVDILTAQEIMKSLSANLSGYLVPKLVQENPGQPNKTTIHY